MKFRWLLMFACLLMVACNNSSEENAQPAPGQAVNNATASAATSNGTAEKEAAKTVEALPAESKSPESEPLDRYSQAQAKYDAEVQGFMTTYRAANEAEREKLASTYPNAGDYAAEFMALAEEYPDHEVAFDSLFWVVSKVGTGDVAETAMNKLFESYIDNESLKNVCMTLSYSQPSPRVESRLNLLIEKSPHDSVKASATFALASYLSRLDETRQYIAANPETKERLDKESIEYLSQRKVEPTEIKTLYEMLIAEYPDLKPNEGSKRTYKSKAEAALFEINSLAIGMIAPEIEGDDLDGISFKLSDYRGKVVMLDFWGDW